MEGFLRIYFPSVIFVFFMLINVFAPSVFYNQNIMLQLLKK